MYPTSGTDGCKMCLTLFKVMKNATRWPMPNLTSIPSTSESKTDLPTASWHRPKLSFTCPLNSVEADKWTWCRHLHNSVLYAGMKDGLAAINSMTPPSMPWRKMDLQQLPLRPRPLRREANWNICPPAYKMEKMHMKECAVGLAQWRIQSILCKSQTVEAFWFNALRDTYQFWLHPMSR